MKFRAITAVVLALAPGAIATAVAPPARPNIIFLLADDLGWNDVGFHGGRAPTPNLDRLARAGVELTQHYVAPVCTPTRVGLLTGRYWSRFGILSVQATRALPWDTVTLPRLLKQAGYDTALIGKWHLGSKPEWGPQHFGFDHSYGSLGGGVGPYKHEYKRGPYSRTWHRNGGPVSEEGHVTDLLVSEAERWIAVRSSSPFFLYLPFTAVHLPIKEPPERLARVPADIVGELPRHYAACITHLDDAVARVVAAVRQAGKADQTLIVFSSDNGGTTEENRDLAYPEDEYPAGRMPGSNRPLRGHKGSLYEGGIRTPSFAFWPERLRPVKFAEPVHIVDWMPTLAAVAGCPEEPRLKWDGVNLWPYLTGAERALPARRLYTPHVRGSVLREGEWKLIVRHDPTAGEKALELFNIRNDEREENDVAGRFPRIVDSLRVRLAEIADRDRDALVR